VADEHTCIPKPLTRRRFLRFGAVAGGGAAIGLGLFGPPFANAATAKVAKQTVSYQQMPKGQARCGTCTFFQAPSSCNYVEGPVNSAGWCMLYRAKT
jgi:anaerobic selenocysteine-containing dehydrogenase